MKNTAKFGFLTGLLAGTAAVGAIGLLLGAAEPHAQHPDANTHNLVATPSPNGSIIYLWRVEADGSMSLLSSTPTPAPAALVHAPGT